MAHAARERFIDRGVNLQDARRLRRCEEILRQVHDEELRLDRDDPVTLQLVGRAVCDIKEFYMIARSLPKERDADTNGKLRVMLRGSSKARDYQFEFFLGAMLAIADIPARPAEPDLRFLFGGQELGIAAKRVTSEGQLAKRTRHAVEQLQQQGVRGIIAVNVEAFMADLPFDVGGDARWAEFDARVKRLHALYPGLSQQDSLIGILAVGQLMGWVFGEGTVPHLHYPFLFQSQGFNGNQTADALLRDMAEQMGSRMSDVQRELDLIVGPRQ